MFSTGPLARLICSSLAMVIAFAPAANLRAQSYGAEQAVRQRVQGLGGQSQPAPVEQRAPAEPDTTLLAEPTAGKIDTTYVAPAAAVVFVLRPAQIMTSPMAELLPTEVATAAGLKYLGFDPATMDEVIACVEMSDPAAPPGYSIAIKFNQPIRGSAIPPESRAHAQVAELAGRKYLQSMHPMLPSFYGPNNRTLILAPDEMLRQLVESSAPAQTGPLLERVREVPSGHDLYLAVDMVAVRPLILMGLAQAPADLPPDAQPLLEAPNLIAAAELMLNISAPGPTSFVLHANDEAAAQQLESIARESAKQYQASPEQASDDPVEQAMARYLERISQPFVPRRNGSTLICFHVDGQNPAQQQMISAVTTGILAALVPAIQAFRQMPQQDGAIEFGEQPDAEFGP